MGIGRDAGEVRHSRPRGAGAGQVRDDARSRFGCRSLGGVATAAGAVRGLELPGVEREGSGLPAGVVHGDRGRSASRRSAGGRLGLRHVGGAHEVAARPAGPAAPRSRSGTTWTSTPSSASSIRIRCAVTAPMSASTSPPAGPVVTSASSSCSTCWARPARAAWTSASTSCSARRPSVSWRACTAWVTGWRSTASAREVVPACDSCLKGFDDTLDQSAYARLDRLGPQGFTRLGARHPARDACPEGQSRHGAAAPGRHFGRVRLRRRVRSGLHRGRPVPRAGGGAFPGRRSAVLDRRRKHEAGGAAVGLRHLRPPAARGSTRSSRTSPGCPSRPSPRPTCSVRSSSGAARQAVRTELTVPAQSLARPTNRGMTDKPFYIADDNEEQLFRAAAEQGMALLIKGPTGAARRAS